MTERFELSIPINSGVFVVAVLCHLIGELLPVSSQRSAWLFYHSLPEILEYDEKSPPDQYFIFTGANH